MRVVLNSFMWEFHLRQQKFFRQTLANPRFIFSGTCWPRLVRRTWMCDILKFVPGVWSLVTLNSVAAALKHLRSALRCWSLLTFIGQFWHNKIRHVYMNFRQNFSQKKIFRHFRKKTLAETVHYIPKGLRKGNPFHGPFAQLSYIYIYVCIYEYDP